MVNDTAKRLTEYLTADEDNLLVFTGFGVIVNKTVLEERITNFFNREKNGALCAASE